MNTKDFEKLTQLLEELRNELDMDNMQALRQTNELLETLKQI